MSRDVISINFPLEKSSNKILKTTSPDEERGGDQHHGEVHGDGGLEVESLEVGGGVADTEQEEGGEVGGHQLIDESPLELHLHLYTFDQTIFLCTTYIYFFNISNLDLVLILKGNTTLSSGSKSKCNIYIHHCR